MCAPADANCNTLNPPTKKNLIIQDGILTSQKTENSTFFLLIYYDYGVLQT